eukprot:3834817-Amphidinium_carterae.1
MKAKKSLNSRASPFFSSKQRQRLLDERSSAMASLSAGPFTVTETCDTLQAQSDSDISEDRRDIATQREMDVFATTNVLFVNFTLLFLSTIVARAQPH